MMTKATGAARMRAELLETARGLHRAGIVSKATLEKITARDVDLDKLPRLNPPSGAEIAYVQVSVNAKHDTYLTSIWIVPASGGAPRQLTGGTRDTAPRWSPDGKRLAFLRAGEKDGKPDAAQIFVLDMAGGEARALTELPKGAGAAVWSPSGRFIAFNSSALPKDSAKAEEKSDVRVITRAAYRQNGQGYTDWERVAHIWTVEVPPVVAEPVKAKQITDGKYADSAPVWAKDEAQLYFVSDHTAEPYYESQQTDLYAVAAKGGEIRKLVHIAGAAVGLSLSPDGKSMAFVSALRGHCRDMRCQAAR